MTDHRKKIVLAVAVIVALGAATAVLAGAGRPRLELPRLIVREPGLQRLEATAGTVLPLGIGKPNSLAMGDTWITSDQLPDDYSTDLAWFNNENLSVFGAFYTTSERDVTVIIQVKDESGATLLDGAFTDTPFPNDITFFVVPIGQYANGAYKLTVKVKQGIKSVGQAYWYGVYDPPVN